MNKMHHDRKNNFQLLLNMLRGGLVKAYLCCKLGRSITTGYKTSDPKGVDSV